MHFPKINEVFWGGLWVEIIGGFLFILILFLLFQPKVFTSNKIAKYIVNGNTIYAIKIINWSYFKLIDISCSFIRMKIVEGGTGVEFIDPFEKRIKKYIYYLDGLYSGSFKSYNPHCGQISVIYEDDLSVFLDGNDGNNHIQVIISCKHHFSGLSTTIVKDYKIGSIKEGKFKRGNSLKIVS